ncbi:sensor histidine kinase [Chitinophaga ginsengisegetis]|uniref:sensor histidine kinase n=1 Tax=Chitinophaga ginsengisegetis TaxID=393003 RepID=UPI000DB9536E|nr:HAMP domain-containing sensor histidine kinase [Chitinophaga ginsengisegetis]MDR6570515.1 signal transduction histidine kinase [Chitinophaga ginsengisegetis]MDR6650249.1 signal transduction histidine kinase [Chitinophaga ginsengisegetis]MDR6656632.1 signal transduction histidine kinase [Chitinophaga ginsengisegetis]
MSTSGTITISSQRLKQFSHFLIGDPQQFSLENRIFNAICAISLFIIAINVPYNYVTGLTVTSLIFALLVPAFSFIYFLSRYRKKVNISIALAVIMINVSFAINYFYSGGIQGASLLSFTLAFFLGMLISPRKQYYWWLALNLFTVLGLIIWEYYYPASVGTVYKTRKDIFADMTPTYIISVGVIFVGTVYLKNAYNKEKQRGEEKTRSLEIMNTEKSKLFSLISHDLRNPLAAIQSYLQLMREIELDPENKTQIETELLYVVNSTQEMLYNILVWSKTQMDGLNVNLTPVDVASAIHPILKINKMAVSKKRISLDTNIDASIKVMADINMLQLIVRNLLGNAAKFTPSGGTIFIKTSRAGNKCLIEVRDSGMGIDLSRQPDIFSLKVRSTFGTDNEKGIGLGLFLCKEYTTAQQGQIWFENNREGGSSFYLELPLAN